MREEAGKSMSRRSDGFSRIGPAAHGPCIDGVAEVTSRRRSSQGTSGQTPASGRGPQFGRRQSADDCRDSARPSDERSHRQPFRPAESVRSPEAGFSQASAVPSQGVSARGMTSTVSRRSGARLGRIGLFVCAFVFGALLLPAFLVSFPETPIAATASNGGGYVVRLDTVEASLKSHGEGRMLKVEGRIRNPAAVAAAVPPLRIDFADSAVGLRSRTLQTSVAHLGAGQSVDFVTMIAMPEDAKGDVSVGFVGTANEGNQ